MKPEGGANCAKKAIVEFEMRLRQAKTRRVTASQLPHMKNRDLRKVWGGITICAHGRMFLVMCRPK